MKLAVLISGMGSNLQALLDAERRGELHPGEIACVISNRPGAGGLNRAETAGKPALVVDHKAFATRDDFEDALHAVLLEHRVEALVLAGFMRLLTPRFVERWPDKIINIHPSLLPAFPGVDAQRQAYEHGVKIAGCTAHFVDAELDGGAIIMQAAVAVHPDDDADGLRMRILAEEHLILPRVAQLLAAGKLSRQGRRVVVMP